MPPHPLFALPPPIQSSSYAPDRCIVMMFTVWGRSLATEQIDGGIESLQLGTDIPLPQKGASSAARFILSNIDGEISSSNANTPSTSGILPVSRDIFIGNSSLNALAQSCINEEAGTPLGGKSNGDYKGEMESVSNTGDDDPTICTAKKAIP